MKNFDSLGTEGDKRERNGVEKEKRGKQDKPHKTK
jgi:hypothetical protein